MSYKDSVRSLLSPVEHRLFSKLRSPQRIQDYLDTLPINFELSGETYMSPRRVLKERKAHCFEGALFAAAALTFNGEKPLIMDLTTSDDDEDHVVALFRINGYWGAISKTNHPILRYRDPVYASTRELAMSYFHEYFSKPGHKSLRAFSEPFDLSRIDPSKWVTAEEELFKLVERLDRSRHFPAVPKKNRRQLRMASKIERFAVETTEWSRTGRKNALFRK